MRGFMFRWLSVALLMAAIPLVSMAEFKVVSLNIEWFPGQKTRPTAEEIARHTEDTRAALSALAPDLLIATEICDEAALRDVLKSVPGLELHVISNFSFGEEETADRRNQQIAIASRLPAIAAWAEPWEATMEHLRRGFSFAALENPETGHLILVYGLHLKSNRSGNPQEEQVNYDIRDESINQLLKHMQYAQEHFADRGIEGWIVAGDFNTNHDGRFGDHVVEKLVEVGFWNSWLKVAPEDRHTWKGRGNFQSTTFDYIMTKGFAPVDASLVVIDDLVSDHNAVVLQVELPKRDDAGIETEAEAEAVVEPASAE